MAMLERNDKGKRVRKYFIEVEKKYKEVTSNDKSIIEQGISIVKFIADDLNVNTASRLLMYENYCKDVGIPTGFLPKYEHNGNRQMKALSTLLKENGCRLSAVKFNQKLIKNGYLEERERPSSKGIKKFKALTENGLRYGENAVNPHNQKEVQPLYYSDMFMELYSVIKETGRRILKLIYPAVFKPFSDQSGGYVVEFPDLPGCVTEGKNLEQAIEMGIDAASGWILGELEDGEKIPHASDIKQIHIEDGQVVHMLSLYIDK